MKTVYPLQTKFAGGIIIQCARNKMKLTDHGQAGGSFNFSLTGKQVHCESVKTQRKCPKRPPFHQSALFAKKKKSSGTEIHHFIELILKMF